MSDLVLIRAGTTHRNIVDCCVNCFDKNSFTVKESSRFREWEYVKELMSYAKDYEYIVNVDADCFINNDVFVELMNYVKANSIDICGISEYKVRKGHPCSLAFWFSIYKTAKLQNMKYEDAVKVTHKDVPEEVLSSCGSKLDVKVEKYKDNNAPYDGFAYYLTKFGCNYHFLNDISQFTDRKATVCKFNGKELFIHAWGSRFYNDRERIDNVISHVNSAKWNRFS